MIFFTTSLLIFVSLFTVTNASAESVKCEAYCLNITHDYYDRLLLNNSYKVITDNVNDLISECRSVSGNFLVHTVKYKGFDFTFKPGQPPEPPIPYGKYVITDYEIATEKNSCLNVDKGEQPLLVEIK